MSFEIPKQEIKKDPQIHLNFEDAAADFALKQKEDYLDFINSKYSEAKIPIHLVEGDEINGYTVKGESLEEYARSQHELYSKSGDKTEEYKDNMYARN